MATGGIANMIHAVPIRFHGLATIGYIFFFTNLGLYLVVWVMILTRFTKYPHTFRASFTHPTESLFVPGFAVSFGTILITVVEYGASGARPWLTQMVLVLFWLDAALAIVLSISIYMILWSTQSFTIARMTPIWIFPAYPLLIVGPNAANLSGQLPDPQDAQKVIIGGFTLQGIGFLVSLTIYSAFIYRLMTQKLPAEPLRPGMFVSVGPSAFTVSALMGMAKNLDNAVVPDSNEYFLDIPVVRAIQILRLIANFMSLWLWGLAFWFLFISIISNLAPLYADKERKARPIPFAMTWYSFIFPQTALTVATFGVADAFHVHELKLVGCAMAVLLTAIWFFVVGMMIRAVLGKQILWPETGEDKDEGGFRRACAADKQS